MAPPGIRPVPLRPFAWLVPAAGSVALASEPPGRRARLPRVHRDGWAGALLPSTLPPIRVGSCSDSPISTPCPMRFATVVSCGACDMVGRRQRDESA